MNTLFVAWQDPESRRWYPVGRLETRGNLFVFTYTKGARRAQSETGFTCLVSFSALETTYVSESLFPLFSNRLLPPSRPEHLDYLGWLGLPESERDPVTILARSGGAKATDTLELFPLPEPNDLGQYEVHFLVRGVRHLPDENRKRALFLKPSEHLLAIHTPGTPDDAEAVALWTAEQQEDRRLIGYCPRYLRSDLLRLSALGSQPEITIERVNRAPAPLQFRVLCRALAEWPAGFEPFSDPDFQPLAPIAEISLPPRRIRA